VRRENPPKKSCREKAKTTLDVKRHLLRCGVWLPSLPSIFLGTGGNEDVVEQVKKRIKKQLLKALL
jgi:hypothetical protein